VKKSWLLLSLPTACALGVSAAAAAVTPTTSFRVTATVTASCTVAAGPWTGGPVCQATPRPAIPLPAPPVITFSLDPQTHVLRQTVAF
jgi:hypothetical protein